SFLSHCLCKKFTIIPPFITIRPEKDIKFCRWQRCFRNHRFFKRIVIFVKILKRIFTKRLLMPSSNPYLAIQNISKSFSQNGPEKVLNDISFEISKGKILGIIGKSGAGKSTLLRCLNGLEKPDTGKILFQGQNLTDLSSQKIRDVRRKIGVVFQSFNLLSTRTVFENVALPLELLKLSDTERQKKVENILTLVGLSSKFNAYPSQLSGGQRQRIAIARALVVDATLLLCDEFTSALDPHTTLEILRLLQDLNRRLGITIIFVTHDINVVKELAQDVCVLDQGKIVEHGAVENVFTNPQHTVTQTLLSELLKNDLPDFLEHQLQVEGKENDDVVLKLIFGSQTSTKPLIANLIQEWKIPINIISGSLDHIGKATFGHLVVSLKHHAESTEKIIKYLTDHQVGVEKAGYIRWQ
ncbi:MAG: ATP-binding cassette domain-containing protein, partial [Alphaproteobacteria bacterium]|nr:ATP-binding cassette domain-containing protein [Alphaproteobacteria bacterium]